MLVIDTLDIKHRLCWHHYAENSFMKGINIYLNLVKLIKLFRNVYIVLKFILTSNV